MNFKESVDWFQFPSPYRPEAAVEVDEETLTFAFRCHKPAWCDKSLNPGDFIEGLWEKDVAEFFVAGPGAAYQEINVCPTGAWWCCLFSEYRKRREVLRFDCEIEACHDDTSWAVTFKVPLEHLVPWQDVPPEERLFSATCILHDPQPHYFAWNHQGGGEPDFHRRDLLQPL